MDPEDYSRYRSSNDDFKLLMTQLTKADEYSGVTTLSDARKHLNTSLDYLDASTQDYGRQPTETAYCRIWWMNWGIVFLALTRYLHTVIKMVGRSPEQFNISEVLVDANKRFLQRQDVITKLARADGYKSGNGSGSRVPDEQYRMYVAIAMKLHPDNE